MLSASCVFRCKLTVFTHAYTLLYIDDLFLFGSTAEKRSATLKELKALYELRIEDRVKVYSGVGLNGNISIHGQLIGVRRGQSRDIEDMLRRSGLQKSKPAPRSMVDFFFFSPALGGNKSSQPVPIFEQMINSMRYMALLTRLDPLAPVVILARFQNAPSAHFHRALKRVLRYLRGTSDRSFLYHPGSLDLNAFIEHCTSAGAKHIDVEAHFIRNLLRQNLVRVEHVPSERNDAVILTKPLRPADVITIAARIGLGQNLKEEG